MNIQFQSAVFGEKDHKANIVSETHMRPQIELSISSLGEIKGIAAVRINGSLFIAAPDGDEILDYEWKTGRVFGS